MIVVNTVASLIVWLNAAWAARLAVAWLREAVEKPSFRWQSLSIMAWCAVSSVVLGYVAWRCWP